MKKILIIRLSSLGDLILATSAIPKHDQVDWVVNSEFASLLDGHPQIRNLVVFDKRTGLRGWVRLCLELRQKIKKQNEYDEIWDLHRNLRSAIAGLILPIHRKISKQRLKTFGYLFFKKLWPKDWYPESWVKRYARFSGDPDTRPDFQFMLTGSSISSFPYPETKYFCVMPSSRWLEKTWPTARYVEWLLDNQKRTPDCIPVILGTAKDQPSLDLVQALSKVSFLDGVGKTTLRETAALLAKAEYYFGSDTGLAHLAEAVGTPVRVIFGPTTPEFGFAPWRKESRAIHSGIACSPCGRDGRRCIRLDQKQKCLKSLTVDEVRREVEGQIG